MQPTRLQLLSLPLVATLTTGLAAAQGQTTRVSLDSFEVEGNESSREPSISGDGRWVAFETWANLDPSDTTPSQFFLDIYLRDRVTGTTEVISRDLNGSNPNDDCRDAEISDDGRFVVFTVEGSDVLNGDDNARRDVARYDHQSGTLALVSAALDGSVGDWDSYEADISGDGNIVVFTSGAGDLTLQDPGQWAIFARDMTTGVTELISKGVGGVDPDSNSSAPAVSSNGRYVVFVCHATNIVPGDVNGAPDIFVYDRQTGAMDIASISSLGAQANSDCWDPSISDDGRFVTFHALASNLVPGDTNGYTDVFLRDRQTGQTTRVSETPTGGNANFLSQYASITPDGRYIAFRSWANNLTGAPGISWLNAYVRDRVTGETRLVSVDSAGLGTNNHNDAPVISADGQWVAFGSDATNLVADDFNAETDVFVHHYGFEVPEPIVKINGSDVDLTVPAGTPLVFTLGMDAGSLQGQWSDWWVVAQTPWGNFWLPPTLAWTPSFSPLLLLQFPLVDFAGFPVLNGAVLPAGTYTLTFYVDDDVDGVFDGTWSDSVSVTVQ